MPGGVATKVGPRELRQWIDGQLDSVELDAVDPKEPLSEWEDFAAKIVIPIQEPSLQSVVYRLQNLERTMKFAVLMAVLDHDRLDSKETLEGVLSYGALIGLQVVGIGISSIDVSFKVKWGDSKKPESRWKSRLAFILGVILGASSILVYPEIGESRELIIKKASNVIRDSITEVCNVAPETKATIDLKYLKWEIPCPKPEKEEPKK